MTTFQIDDDVFLRPFSNEDVDAVLAVVNRNYDHLRTFMEWAKVDYSISDARDFLTRAVTGATENKSLNFGIFRDHKFIGTIGLAYFDDEAKVTEIGYWIDGDEEGKGLMTRACGLVLEHAFGELGMNRVQIRCATANLRSAAIPERFGFTLEGVQRQHIIRDGKHYDFAIYGLLAFEWKRRSGSEPGAIATG